MSEKLKIRKQQLAREMQEYYDSHPQVDIRRLATLFDVDVEFAEQTVCE